MIEDGNSGARKLSREEFIELWGNDNQLGEVLGDLEAQGPTASLFEDGQEWNVDEISGLRRARTDFLDRPANPLDKPAFEEGGPSEQLPPELG